MFRGSIARRVILNNATGKKSQLNLSCYFSLVVCPPVVFCEALSIPSPMKLYPVYLIHATRLPGKPTATRQTWSSDLASMSKEARYPDSRFGHSLRGVLVLGPPLRGLLQCEAFPPGLASRIIVSMA